MLNSQKGLTLTKILLIGLVLVGIVGFFSYDLQKARDFTLGPIMVTFIGIGIVIAMVMYAWLKSKKTGQPVGEIVFEQTYKEHKGTNGLLMFASFVIVFAFSFVGISGIYERTAKIPWVFIFLMLIAAFLSPLYSAFTNWAYFDSKRRNMNASFWGITFGQSSTNLLGLIIMPAIVWSYFQKRKQFPVVDATIPEYKFPVKRYTIEMVVGCLVSVLLAWLLVWYLHLADV